VQRAAWAAYHYGDEAKALLLMTLWLLAATLSRTRPQRRRRWADALAERRHRVLNSLPLDRAALKGKVVLIDFWTYTCINCLRALPYVKAWDAKYRAAGLVVIGVHTPEFDFEGDKANVEMAVRKYGIHYPVVVDKNRKIWDAVPQPVLACALFHRRQGPDSRRTFWRG